MTTRFYLDARHLDKNNEAVLYIVITKHRQSAYYPVGVKLEPVFWNKEKQIIENHPNQRMMKMLIENKKLEFNNALLKLEIDGTLGGLSAKQVKDKVEAYIKHDEDIQDEVLFLDYFLEFAKGRKSANTKRIYIQTYKKLLIYANRKTTFEDITKKWLVGFESYLSNERNNDTNTIAIDMRNIRAVVNDAIDNGITSVYSFRKKYKIKQKQTRKRSLSVEKLRELFDYNVESFLQKYIDTFKLTFFLIGINTVDLCALKKIEDGRIIYERAKTGRLYSVKVEPEALELFEKYKGKEHLFGLAEGAKDYFSFLTNLDKYLKQVGPVVEMKKNKRKSKKSSKTVKKRISAFPGLSIYWARHTWATIAASLDIPRETISAALGHGYGNQTTAIYIDFDLKKIDEANRKVIDYVLYNKVY